MKKQRIYERPTVLREMTLAPSDRLLAESVVDSAYVRSVGQEVVDTDWSDNASDFNHVWGE